MPRLFSFLNARIWAKIAKQKKLAFMISSWVNLKKPIGIYGYSWLPIGSDSFLFLTQFGPMLTKTKKADFQNL